MQTEEQQRPDTAHINTQSDLDALTDDEAATAASYIDAAADIDALLQHVCSLGAFKPSIAEEHHAARFIAGDITLAEFLAAEV